MKIDVLLCTLPSFLVFLCIFLYKILSGIPRTCKLLKKALIIFNNELLYNSGALLNGRLVGRDGRRALTNFYPEKMSNFDGFQFKVSAFNYPPMVRYSVVK